MFTPHVMECNEFTAHAVLLRVLAACVDECAFDRIEGVFV